LKSLQTTSKKGYEIFLNRLRLTNTNMFNPSPFASAANREIYHTVLAQRLKVETARRASERKKDLERIPKVEEAIQKVIN
jgi:hypothetical protein